MFIFEVIDQLLNAEFLLDLSLQFIESHAAGLELLIKLLFGKGRAKFVELGVYVSVGCHDAELLRLLEHDLVIDQAAEDLHFLRQNEILTRSFRGLRVLQTVGFVEFCVCDSASID
jgi:hypothetical protein